MTGENNNICRAWRNLVLLGFIALLSMSFAAGAEGNITQEQAFNALLQAEKDMAQMQDDGFGVSLVNDTLPEQAVL